MGLVGVDYRDSVVVGLGLEVECMDDRNELDITSAVYQLQKRAKEANVAQVATDKATALEALRQGHTLSYAAGLIGLHRSSLDYWRREDLTFAKEVASALTESAGDVYEEHLLTASSSGNHPVATIVGLKMKGRFVDKQEVHNKNLNLTIVSDLRSEHSLEELKAMLTSAKDKDQDANS